MRRFFSFLSSKVKVFGKFISKLFTRPWLRAYSGLSINLSAAFFIGSLVGPNIFLPRTALDFVILSVDFVAGIIFLLITVRIEKELLK